MDGGQCGDELVLRADAVCEYVRSLETRPPDLMTRIADCMFTSAGYWGLHTTVRAVLSLADGGTCPYGCRRCCCYCCRNDKQTN